MFRAKSLIHSFCNMFCLSKTIVTQLCMHPKREDHFQPLFLRRVLSALACRCWPSAWEDGDRLGHLASARGPWSPVRPHVRLPEGHRPPDNTTYGPRNIYVSVPPDTQNVLRFARNLRTYQVSSWGRGYNSGLVDSTHFCLADEAVKEKTITQRWSMYVRMYLFLFGLKNQLKEARGQEAPTPLDTDQLSSCSYYCLSPGGVPWHRVE